MVTFYRKARMHGNLLTSDGDIDRSQSLEPMPYQVPKYAAMIDPADELPYVVVRPKINRKKNDKKVMRMRNDWD